MKPLFALSTALLGGALTAGCTSPIATETALLAAPAPSQKSPSATSIKRIAEVPGGQKSPLGLTLPRGFEISVLAEGLQKPRRLAFAPGATKDKYDVFVAESSADRVSVLRVEKGQLRSKNVFSGAFSQPYGIAFGAGSVYVANTDSVVRFPFQSGDVSASGTPQKIATLTRGGYNQHWTRNLLFSRDQKQLFVTVGSSCNTCEEDDPQRAAISVMNPDGSDKRVFASGLRNPVGVALRPGSDELWTVVNERDNLGDDIPPDYLTRVKSGAFYGWPYAYTDIERRIFPDPSYGSNTAMVAKTVAPDVPVQAHSAALGVAFYPEKGGNFPTAYRGDAFLAFHGSWNRSAKTGYKIVRVDFENGRPKTVSDFVTGYLTSDGATWGRPVDVQIAPDGSLLFSDDGGGKIWRVSFKGKSIPKSVSSGDS